MVRSPPAMDPSFSGFVLDPSKCSKLRMEEKRELVHELSKWPEGASEMLQSWSRKVLLEILCTEMGKERKYTGLTKQKLIEHLLRIVSEKKSGKHVEDIDSSSHPPPPTPQTSSKRQRKAEHPSRLPIGNNDILVSNPSKVANNPVYCQNLACRAAVSLEDAFCKRCSCCICYSYDDNKDPSIWLVCSSDPPSQGNSCGMSCHLECAIKHERAGIVKSRHGTRLDGSFYCVSCGKINDLLGCWRKQLTIAKDARRVDILCSRISLSHRLLNGTEKYQNLHEIVGTAMKKLEAEVGPLNALPFGMARGIVNRLSSATEVQKLCALAVNSLDSMLSSASQLSPEPKNPKSNLVSSAMIRFEDISSTSLTVVVGSENDAPFSEEVEGYTLWHRSSDAAGYPSEPTCKLVKPDGNFFVSQLTPATEYLFKVIAFSNKKDVGKWESGVKTDSISKDDPKNLTMEGDSPKPIFGSSKTNSSGLSNPSDGDESNNTATYGDLNKLPENYLGCYDKPDKPERSTDGKETSHSQDTCIGTIASRIETLVQEETPGHSVSALDEEPNLTIRDSTNSTDQNQASDTHKFENESKSPIGNEMVPMPFRHLESVLPVTPSKLEASKEGTVRNAKAKSGSSELEDWLPKPVKEVPAGSSSKKKGPGVGEELCNKDGSLEGNYEYCVKVIRWLERKGHIETNFRVKFLTWFSLRATPQERRVVSVFVDTLVDDPPSLAGQLVDTFSEGISSKRPPSVPTGFCTRLWH